MTEIIRMENGISVLDARASGKIAEFERQLKAIKEQEEKLKKAILEEMESKGIIKVEDEISGISITYVAESYRETFDSKKFRADNPDMYDDYIRMSPVKPSIRIKVKE
jgi:hypothetical protein